MDEKCINELYTMFEIVTVTQNNYYLYYVVSFKSNLISKSSMPNL